jgi:ABC-type nitrate/sulfonate/bicarbonate transport system substrate-binding protein
MAFALTVMVFPGTQTLPLYAAQALSLFEQRGLAVEVKSAPSSQEQRSGLAQGRYQIVHGAADQAVAMVEGAHADAVIVMGGDNGFNHLFVRPEITSLAALRGKTLAADAVDTGWSFVLYDILRRHGLARDDYQVAEVGAPLRRFEAMREGMAAAILNPPNAFHARRAGFTDLGAVVDTIGPYLGTVPYVLRGWAQTHADALVTYLQCCLASLRWARDPANAAAATALYAERLGVPADIAAQMCAIATDPIGGLAADAAFDLAGLLKVLALRAAATGAALAPPERYFDLSYYRRALARL